MGDHSFVVLEKYHVFSDEQIIQKILSGERKLFEVLMRRYNQQLFRIQRAYIKEEENVKEVLQTTYIKVYTKLHTFKKKSCFSTWLVRIAINEALLYLKRNKKYTSVFENIEYSIANNMQSKSHEDALINFETKMELENAVDLLPIEYRTVFIMRAVENLSTKEVSEYLGISESNVKIRLKRAKQKLKNYLINENAYSAAYVFLGKRCDEIVLHVMNVIPEESSKTKSKVAFFNFLEKPVNLFSFRIW